MMENRSFDHYLGWLPGRRRPQHGPQLPRQRRASSTRPISSRPTSRAAASRTPTTRWEGGREQYNRGKLDGFLRSANDDFAIGYYDEDDLPFIPARREGVHDLRPLLLLAARADLPQPRVHAVRAVRRPDRQRAFPRGTLGDNCGDDLRPRSGGRARASATSTSTCRSRRCAGSRAAPWIRHVAEFYADARGREPAATSPSSTRRSTARTAGHLRRRAPARRHPRRPGVHGGRRRTRSWSSPQFRRGAMFIIYDEWGGFFDHVQPPLRPRRPPQPQALARTSASPGFRDPGGRGLAVRAPRPREPLDLTHESILKLIAYRFGLGFLNKRHRYASQHRPHVRLRAPELRRARPAAARARRARPAWRPPAGVQGREARGPLDRLPGVRAPTSDADWVSSAEPATPDRIFPHPGACSGPCSRRAPEGSA